MILKFFRSSQPVIAFFVPLAALFTWPVYLAGNYELLGETLTPSFFPFLKGNYFNAFPWLSATLAAVLVILQSLIFNRIIGNNELFDKSGYIPCLVFILVSMVLSVNGMLNGMLVANTFLLIALGKILSVYRQYSSKSEIFEAAFWIGVAALLNYPLYILLLFLWVAILILKSPGWREWFLSLTGILLPLFLGGVLMFGINGEIHAEFQWNEENDATVIYPFTWDNYFHRLTLVFFFVVFAVSLVSYRTNMVRTILKIRRQRLVLLFLFVFSVAAAVAGFLSGYPFCLQSLIIPLSLIISSWLVHANRQGLTGFFFWLLIICLLLAIAENGKLIRPSMLFY